jgi:hypothetical protein
MVEERTRDKETKLKAEIFRNETKKSISGMILEQKEMSVVGDDLDKVKAIFDEEWAK